VKTSDWIRQTEQELREIPTARLDALVLLEGATHKDRAWLLAHPEFELNKDTLQTLNGQIARRAKHEPLAYIRGRSEFYGREFIITPDTLEPRPETETMIELLKKLDAKQPVIADIGTGSGAIAITAALELPGSIVYATEINEAALEVAQRNAQKLQSDVRFFKGNLYEPLAKLRPAPTVLLANLPYVPDSHTINQAAMHEPRVAIFGGEDGLDLYGELFDHISKNATKLQFLLTESLPFQHETLRHIARQAGFVQSAEEDFIQVFERS
jgi:release factor glutamine methyltransferase